MGINIREELAKGLKDGKSPLDVIVEQTLKATKGDLGKLGDFFGDAQVQKGLRALIQNFEEFQKIREKAGNASGVVDADFETRIGTLQTKIDGFNASVQNLAITLGTALSPAIGGLLDVATQVADALEKIVALNPDLASGAILAAGGLLALNTAALFVRMTLVALGAVKLTSLATLAALGTGGTAAGLLKVAGGITAIALALNEVQKNEPAMLDWLDKNARPEGKAGTGFKKPEGFMMTGTNAASAAGQAVNEWIRKLWGDAAKTVDNPTPALRTIGKAALGVTGYPNAPENVSPARPEIQVNAGDSETKMQMIREKLGELDGTVAAPGVSLNGANTTLNQLQNILSLLNKINSTSVSPPGLRGAYSDAGVDPMGNMY